MVPPTTILPSDWKARLVALARLLKGTVVLPPVPKAVSSVPSALNRAIRKFVTPEFDVAPNPAVTILPSAWTAMAWVGPVGPSNCR